MSSAQQAQLGRISNVENVVMDHGGSTSTSGVVGTNVLIRSTVRDLSSVEQIH